MPRYSSRPLPGVRYLPGRSLHPRTDPAREALGDPQRVQALDPAAWRAAEPYLYAIDLFNAGCWWEAHEVFEELWRAAGRDTPVGQFLQGLIQLAAAFLKAAIGSRAVAEGLARSGCTKLRGSPAVFLGIAAHELASSVERYFANRVEPIPRIDLSLD